MKRLNTMLFLGALSLAACNQETKTTETTESTTVRDDQTAGHNTDYEAENRNRANRIAAQMASEMKLDSLIQRRVETAYINRARRLAEIQNRYNLHSDDQSGGLSTDADTTGLYRDIYSIDVETDQEFESILSPVQFRTYQTNRSTYFGEDIVGKVKIDGDEIKIKTDEMKVKAEPGESKVETSTYKSKIDGDESKYKSDDVKIKEEPGKTKYKSDDLKVKIKEKD
jgi:hypothetical protein